MWWLLLACRTVPADLDVAVAVEQPSACISVQLDRWDEDRRAAQLLALRQTFTTTIRQDLRWDYVQPARDAWDWTTEDAVLGDAERDGIEVIAMVGYGNPWATSVAGADHFYPPDDPQDFATFAAEAAARYPQITRFEVWNEPNAGYRFWKQEPYALSGDPVAYAELFVATAEALHAVNPDAEVIFGSVFFHEQGIVGGIDFLEAAIAARPEILEVADAVSFHPYTLYPPRSAPESGEDGEIPLEEMIAQVRDVTGDKPILITEIGWPVWGAVTEELQADWLQRSYAIAHANGVRDVCWYSLEDRVEAAESPEDSFGLFRRGLATAKPAGQAWLEVAYNLSVTDVALVEATEALGLASPARAVRYLGPDSGHATTVLWTTEGEVEAELAPSHREKCDSWLDLETGEAQDGVWEGVVDTHPRWISERWGDYARCGDQPL